MTQPVHRQPTGPFPFEVVTDSTCDLGQPEMARLGVTCLPLSIELEGKQYRDWADLDPETLYSRMRDGHQATTAPPSIQAFVKTYRPLLEGGKKILSLHLSGRVSETVAHAREAVRQLGAADRITVVDSQLASAGLAELMLTAVRVRDQGGTLDEAVARIGRIGPEMFSEFVVPNLEYLQRSGRLSRTGLLLGTLTGLRPVLGFESGRIAARRRVRVQQAEQDVVRQLEDQAQGRPVAVTVFHAGRDQARLQQLQSAVRSSRLNVVRGRVQLIGCVIGAHVGPGTYGFLTVPADPA